MTIFIATEEDEFMHFQTQEEKDQALADMELAKQLQEQMDKEERDKVGYKPSVNSDYLEKWTCRFWNIESKNLTLCSSWDERRLF